MRRHILLALALLVALHAVRPLVEAPTVAAAELDRYLGQTVALEGRVTDVRTTPNIAHVTLRDAAGTSAHILLRTEAPPMGALVRVQGDAAADRDGGPAVVWARGPLSILDVPDPRPRPLAVVLRDAPEMVGTTVAVVGTWTQDDGPGGGERLRGTAGSLAVRATGLPAPDVGPAAGPDEGADGVAGRDVLAWGPLVYVESEAAYRLDVVGWEPWTLPLD